MTSGTHETAPKGRVVLLIGGGRLSLVAVPRSKAVPVRLATAPLVETTEPGSDESLQAIVDVATPMLAERSVRSVVLGLPESWLEHRVLRTPSLKELDALALIQRELTTAADLPADDLLFGRADDPVLAPGRRRKVQSVVRLVAATRESWLMRLATKFRAAGVVISSAVPTAAALLSRMAREASRAETDGSEERPTAIVFLRADGFAIALHEAGRLHQFRLVDVALPEDTTDLARVVTEELRRSSMYFRESTKGRDVAAALVCGRFTGDGEEFAGLVSAASGIDTTVDETCGADTDVLLEASAAARLGDSLGARGLEMMPPEVANRRSHLVTAVLAGLTIAATIGVCFFVSAHLGADTDRCRATLDDIEMMRPELEEMSSSYDRFVHDKDEFMGRRDYVVEQLSSRVDVSSLLLDVGGALPNEVHLQSLTISTPLGGEPFVRLDARMESDQWDFDGHLALLQESLRADVGLTSEMPQGETAEADGTLIPFQLDCWPTEGEDE